MASLIDHSAEVLAQLARNKKAALTAMGKQAEGMVLDQMQGGYGRPIRRTGDLMRDVSSEVERSAPDTVDIGNSLKYAPFVHEGTRKMTGRPYIKDALEQGKEELTETAKEHMKQGF